MAPNMIKRRKTAHKTYQTIDVRIDGLPEAFKINLLTTYRYICIHIHIFIIYRYVPVLLISLLFELC